MIVQVTGKLILYTQKTLKYWDFFLSYEYGQVLRFNIIMLTIAHDEYIKYKDFSYEYYLCKVIKQGECLTV